MSWRGGRRLALPDTGPGVRGLLLLFAAVWVTQVWGPDHGAVPVAVALAIMGSVLTQRSAHDNRPVAAVVTFVLAMAAAIGILADRYPPLFIAVVAAACLGAGLMWVLGGGAGLTGVGVVAVMLTAGAVAPTLSATLSVFGLVVGFGAAHLLFAARWTRRESLDVEREAAARYRALAGYAAQLVQGRVPESTEVAEFAADRAAPDQIPGDIAETLRCLCAETSGGCRNSACDTSLKAAAEVLDALGDERKQAQSRAADALHRLDESRTSTPTAATCRLRGQLHRAVAARYGLDEPLSARSPRVVVGQVADQMRWGSPLVRHAVRLALGVGGALALALYQDVPEGMWMPLAVLLVLRPGGPHFYTWCYERITGVLVGLTLATAITVIWHPGPPVIAFLVVAFLAGGWALHALGPWGLTTVLTAAIAIVMVPSGVDGLLGHRILAAAIGAGIAVWLHLLLPDAQRAKVCRAITEVLRAQLAYAAAEIRAFVDPVAVDAEERTAARHEALTARRVFEAAAHTAHLGGADTAGVLESARREACALAVAVAVLDTQLPRHRHSPGTALREAGEEYVAALLGSGMPWRLDSGWLLSAEEALRLEGAALTHDEGVAVLLAQVEAITRHAPALGELAERVTGHLSYAYAVGDNVH